MKKDTLNRSRARAEMFLAQQQYSECHKEVKSCVQQGKRRYIEDLAKHAQEAVTQRNMKELYDTTKKLIEQSSEWNSSLCMYSVYRRPQGF